MSDALSDDGSHDDSQEDVMTPAELIVKLEEVSWTRWSRRHTLLSPVSLSPRSSCSRLNLSQAWLNEKFSPELMENRSEVVECVMEQLTHMVNTAADRHCVFTNTPCNCTDITSGEAAVVEKVFTSFDSIQVLILHCKHAGKDLLCGKLCTRTHTLELNVLKLQYFDNILQNVS